MGALVVTSPDGVDHRGDHGGAHGDEPGEGERGALAAGAAAGGRECIKHRGQDVHHTGGKDDPGRKQLDREEDVPVGPEWGRRVAQDGHKRPCRAQRPNARMDATAKA